MKEGGTIEPVEIEVRYAETDQMGVVHHSNYLVWFELARTALCRKTGYHYREIEEMGYQLLVTAAQLDYRLGARYGDTVRVDATLDRLTSRSLAFGYRVEREGDLLVRGSTDHVWVDVSRGRACRIPERLVEPFRTILATE